MMMRRYAAPVALVLLAGCAGSAASQGAAVPATGGSGGVAVPMQPMAQSRSAATRPVALLKSQAVSPDVCDKGKIFRILAKGGAFAVSPCSGWTGTINYPPSQSHYEFEVTSSVANNFGAPAPSSGHAIFYMQVETHHSPHHVLPDFFNTGVTDSVSSPQFTSNHTYTLLVYNLARDSQCGGGPSGCPAWIASLGSPTPSTNSITFISPLNGALIDDAAVFQFVQN